MQRTPCRRSRTLRYPEGEMFENPSDRAKSDIDFRLLVPLLGVFHGTALIADEVEDRTLTYLFTRPFRRGAVLVGASRGIIFIRSEYPQAIQTMRAAIDTALRGEVDAVTTAPINKAALHAAGHNYPGHTEIFAERMHVARSCMAFFSDELVCSLVTVHIGYHVVPAALTTQRILDVIELTADAVRRQRGREYRPKNQYFRLHAYTRFQITTPGIPRRCDRLTYRINYRINYFSRFSILMRCTVSPARCVHTIASRTSLSARALIMQPSGPCTCKLSRVTR